MRIFTFWLMLTVAVGGAFFGYRLATGSDLVPFSALGIRLPSGVTLVAAGAPRVTATPFKQATLVATPSPTAAPKAATATPMPTSEPTTKMYIANTEGRGAFLRRGPRDADRIRAWNEGTEVVAIGDAVEGDGQQWRKVRMPEGDEGYMPEMFLSEERPAPVARPTAAPTAQSTPRPQPTRARP